MSIDWSAFNLDHGVEPHYIANQVKRATTMPPGSSIADFFNVLLRERDAGGPAWRTAMLNFVVHAFMRSHCDESKYAEAYQQLDTNVKAYWKAFADEINRIPLSDEEEDDSTH